MRAARRGSAGFSLIEVMVALAITLTIAGVLYTMTRSSLILHRTVSHETERGISGLRALDDMAVEIARAGFGLGGDDERLFPGLPGGRRTSDAITVRSRPGGVGEAVREVRYGLKTDRHGALVLAKMATGQMEQVLARHVGELRFEYLDEAGEPVAPARIRRGRAIGGVRITLRLLSDPAGPKVNVPPLSLLVSLEPHAATVPFDVPRPGFHLRRVFFKIENAVGVVSRPSAGIGVILAVSPVETNWLYTFPLQKLFGDVRIDTVVHLAPVRDAAVLGFAPEDGEWSGSLLVATGAVRAIQVWRVSPDIHGGIGPASSIDLAMETREMTNLGGAAFGMDGALYLSDPSRGAIFRYVPGLPASRNARVDRVASIPGRPGPLVLGDDGSIYCLGDPPDVEETGGAVLWELPFDDAGVPQPPRRVARLAGEPRSLATDPLTGSLFALLRDRLGDTVLLELARPWLRQPHTPPREAFRLSLWRKETQQTLPKAGDPIIPLSLLPTRLDFASFDASGLLYLGAAEVSLVLQAEMGRPGAAFHRIGVTGIVGQDPLSAGKKARLHAWKKPGYGL